MMFSKHAEKRCNQRGIRLVFIDLILTYGECYSDQHNAAIYMISAKATKKILENLKAEIKTLEIAKPQGWENGIQHNKNLIQRFDKLRGKTVIINEEGHSEIITAYKAKPSREKSILNRLKRSGDWK